MDIANLPWFVHFHQLIVWLVTVVLNKRECCEKDE